MDQDDAWGLRDALDDLNLGAATSSFAGSLGSGAQGPGSLLVVGTPESEPWHLVAHLAEGAHRLERPELVPTWVRSELPSTALRPHLSVTVERLAEVRSHQTVPVVTPRDAPERLLDRVEQTRRRGARVVALHKGGAPLLEGPSHEVLEVPSRAPVAAFDLVQHVGPAFGAPPGRRGRRRGPRGA